MKKVNINFLLAMIITIVIAVVAGTCVVGAIIVGDAVKENVQEMEKERLTDDEIDDVEGYGYIINYFGAGASGLFTIGLWIIAVIAILYALLLFVFSLVARLVFADSKGRLLAYRILMGIEYGLQSILAFGALTRMSFSRVGVIFGGIASVLILAIVYSATNTYSEKIIS